MAEYKIKEEDKNIILKNRVIKLLPIFIITALVGIGISIYQINNPRLIAMIILPTVLICGMALFFGLKIGIKSYKSTYLDFIVRIEENIISIIKNDKIYLSFSKEKIKKIEQYKDNSIIFFLIDNNKVILSNKIENYEQLILEIQKIYPIDKKSNIGTKIFTIIGTIIMLALMAIFYISMDRLVILTTGILIIIFMLIVFIKLFFDKQIEKKVKLWSLVIFIIIFQIIIKIIEIL